MLWTLWLVVWNSIDTIDTVLIPFGIVEYRYVIYISILGIVTGIVTKSAKKKKKKSKTEIIRKQGKCRRNLKNSKSESWNMWLTCGCEFCDDDFRNDTWVSILIDTIDTFAKICLLCRYIFSSILPITNCDVVVS